MADRESRANSKRSEEDSSSRFARRSLKRSPSSRKEPASTGPLGVSARKRSSAVAVMVIVMGKGHGAAPRIGTARSRFFRMISHTWAQTTEGRPDPAGPVSISAVLIFSEDDGARTRNLRRDRPGNPGRRSPP